MRINFLIIAFVLGLVLVQGYNGLLQAQTPHGYPTPTPDFTYHLQRFALAGTKPTVYLWTLTRPTGEAVSIDGVAFRSLKSPSLRQWVTEWQHDGTVPITYITDKNLNASTDPVQYQSLTRELNDFAEFCKSQGEPFFVSPSPKQQKHPAASGSGSLKPRSLR